MDNMERKPMPLFWKVFIVYVLFVGLVFAAGLRYVYLALDTYEMSGAHGYIDNYMSGLRNGITSVKMEKELDVLDENIADKEKNLKFIRKLLAEAYYEPVAEESGESFETLAIYTGQQQIGEIKIRFSGATRYGFELWEMADESWDFSAYISDDSCYLPEGYSFNVGKAVYTAGEETKNFETLSPFYERYEDLPTMYLYRSGKYLGEVKKAKLDAEGNELSEEQLNEQYYLNNCDEELNERLTTFAEDFVDDYVDFRAVADNYFYGNYMSLKELIEPKSLLWEAVEESVKTDDFIPALYGKVSDFKVNICSQLAENLYMIDLNYTSEIKHNEDPVVEKCSVRLIVRENAKGKLVAVSMDKY